MTSNGRNGKLTTAAGAPVADNNNVMTAGPRGPMLMTDVWYQEKLAHFHRELIPERRMHAKGSGAYGTFTVTNDITRYTRAKHLLRDRQADRDVRPVLRGRRRTWRRRRGPRHPWVRHEVLHRGGQLGHRRQQHPGLLHAGPAEVSRPQPRGQARPAHQHGQPGQQLGLVEPAAGILAPGHHHR